MKKIIVSILIVALLAALLSCADTKDDNSSSVDTSTSGETSNSTVEQSENEASEPSSAEETAETSLMESSETSEDEWLNEGSTVFQGGPYTGRFVILELRSDCFFAYEVPIPSAEYDIDAFTIIKFNTAPDDGWCEDDYCYITYDNVYLDINAYRAEAELVSIEWDTVLDFKPVIYLYPQEETNVSVKLDYSGELTCTYPQYNDGWNVTAKPDGTLTDEEGKTYNYLYWEGIRKADWDMSKGFCVKGEDTAAFLEEALAKLGLNRREANEFIVFWLPLMQENPYNIISFQTDVYTNSAKLEVSPKPDTLIRVFMAYKATDTEVEIEPQPLSSPERTGFTVIEWGGSIIS